MKKILGQIVKICKEKKLIEEGDKIAVGLSGGKDSLFLLSALKKIQQYYDEKFEIVGITIDLSNGIMNYDEIEAYCRKLDIEYHKKTTNIFEIIFDIRKEKNPCSLCANMRRGALNKYAAELGCNKVALGHHMDDLIETFLLSLFFEGRMSTFKPKTYLTNTKITVIRPLLYVKEQDIIKFSKNLPIVKNICKVDKTTQRQKAKDLFNELEKRYPDAKNKIFNAIKNPNRNNLWE